MATIQKGQILRNDLNNWDGITKTASRIDSTGGTITGVKIGDAIDVLMVYGGGTNYTAATINDALASLSSTNATFIFATGTWTINADVTIPSNITCFVPAGCIFNISAGITLTINGFLFKDQVSISSGSGTLTTKSITNPTFYDISSDEIAGGVTPTNYEYAVGNIKRYGGKGDGTTDDTTALQTAINAVINSGGLVFLPTGTYKITDTILLKASGVHIMGEGFRSTVVKYVKTAGGIAFSGDSLKQLSLTTYTSCSMRNFSIYGGDGTAPAATDPDICVDLTSFSYSYFELNITNKRTNGILYYGQGNNGASPYYNKLEGYLIGGDGAGGSAYTQIGIQFKNGLYSGGSNGPNANVIGPFPRCASLDMMVDLQGGTGNLFHQMSGESIITSYFRFNYAAAADDSGTSTGSNTSATLNDTVKSWTSAAYVNDAIKITGGTGSGQVRIIKTNTSTAITVDDPWSVIPDATSTYDIYTGSAQGNKVSQCRGEGLSTANPDFIYAYPGTIKTIIDQCEVQSLGSGLYVRDDSGATSNSWYNGAKFTTTELLTNIGTSANIDVYARLSGFGGLRLVGNYIVEWLGVTAKYTGIGDTLTVTLDVGGSSVGAGDMTLQVVIPNGQQNGVALPAATEKIIRDAANKPIFLNVASGAAYSASYDDVNIAWCVTLF